MTDQITPHDESDTISSFLITLNSENTSRIFTLTRWMNILGFITILWGILNLVSLFTYKGNVLMLFPILLFTIFFIFLGTRLTSSTAQIRQGVQQNNGEIFLRGLDQLRLYFTICVISLILLLLIAISLAMLIATFGIALENFQV